MVKFQLEEVEIKERLTPEHFKQILKEWAMALDSGTDWDLTLKGKKYRIPAQAWTQGTKREIEYEVEDGVSELQLKVKWS